MKVLFVSLGCDKNTVDSEKVLKRFLTKYNCDIAVNGRDADIVIINTCSFIHDAKKESINYIKHYNRLKKEGLIKKLLVLGCLVTENSITHEYDSILNDVDVSLSLENYLSDLDKLTSRTKDLLSFSKAKSYGKSFISSSV